MRLVYLMRHGEASLEAPSDDRRPLTPQGKTSVAAAAAYLEGKLCSVPLVMASPLLRAQETADIVVAGLSGVAAFKTSLEIAPAGSPAAASKMVSALAGDVIVITHQPFVGRFAEYLTGQKVFFDTANVVAIQLDEIDQDMGEIAWVYSG